MCATIGGSTRALAACQPLATATEGAMFRYKGFDSAQVGGDLARLEVVINEWMQAQHPRIRLVAQPPRGDQIFLSFVYEDGSDVEHRLARSVAVPEVFETTLDEADLDPDDLDDSRLPEAELPY
jgi:hypothetical protein